MKIALINQPATHAVKPIACDSLAIWTYEVARRIAQSHTVIFYGKKQNPEPGKSSQIFSQTEEGINYRGVSDSPLDKGLKSLRIFDRLGLVNSKRPVFASRLYALGYIRQVAQDLTQQNSDLIHIQNYSQFVPIVKSFNPTAKIILHMHCEWLTQLDETLIDQRLEKTDLILGCSTHITGKIRDRFPQYAEKCQTVFNGVDPDNFPPTPTPESKPQKTLLYVGRVSPEKGVHVLVEAFKIVAEKDPTIQLKIVGPEAVPGKELLVGVSEDPKVSKLERFYSGESYLTQIKKLIPPALKEQVVFTGGVLQRDLPQLYHEADILINPSLSEAFGMSLVEAMATETPVIAARVGGMKDVVEEGKTGLFFESDDAIGLADAIFKLIENDELRKSIGKACHQRVLDYFSWDKVAESLLKQYQTIAEF